MHHPIIALSQLPACSSTTEENAFSESKGPVRKWKDPFVSFKNIYLKFFFLLPHLAKMAGICTGLTLSNLFILVPNKQLGQLGRHGQTEEMVPQGS